MKRFNKKDWEKGEKDNFKDIEYDLEVNPSFERYYEQVVCVGINQFGKEVKEKVWIEKSKWQIIKMWIKERFM